MKRLTTLFLALLFAFPGFGTIYYVATDGDDSDPGTITEPFATWQKLEDVLTAGDTGYIRGGTYTATISNQFQCRWDGLTGTESDTIKIWAYPGETPIWDFSGGLGYGTTPYIIQLDQCDYVWIKGLTVCNAEQPENGTPVFAWSISNSSDILIENCTVHDIGGWGFVVANEGWGLGVNNIEVCEDILFLNCDSYANANPNSPTPYSGSDGFSITHNTEDSPARNNWAKDITFRGCRAWFNSDDGWDFYKCDSTGIVLENCWSFFNGYLKDTTNAGDGAGFKLGPNGIAKISEHQFTIFNCIAAKNRDHGFDQNSTEFSSIHKFYNNFAYDNVDRGFYFAYYLYYPIEKAHHIFRNNAALNNSTEQSLEPDSIIQDHNSWSGVVTQTEADYESLQYSQLFNARKSNGDLPDIKFGHLVFESDLIDAGVDVELDYIGLAPDIGAFEFEFVWTEVMTSNDIALIYGSKVLYYTTIDIPVDPYGEEEITNGDFDVDENWVKHASVSIVGGVADFVSTPEHITGAIKQYNVVTESTTYRVEFTITEYTSGIIRVGLEGGGGGTGTERSSTGTFVEILTAVSSGTFYLNTRAGGFDGKVDNVSVKEVL